LFDELFCELDVAFTTFFEIFALTNQAHIGLDDADAHLFSVMNSFVHLDNADHAVNQGNKWHRKAETPTPPANFNEGSRKTDVFPGTFELDSVSDHPA